MQVRAKARVLFVAENVTLAQVVRLATLARALDPEAYEVHFACSEFSELVFGGAPFVRHPLESLEPRAAARRLDAGGRLYEKSVLLRYIEAERRLIETVRPALVVGDFRWSLPTSAELCGIPSAVLINAYWSPYAQRARFPVPDHPILGWLGETLTEEYFPRALPSVFRHFAAPLNAARKSHGLGAVGSLLEVLTHADHTLYPDDPGLTPVNGAPATHRFLGPVLWQPEHCPAAAPGGALSGADSPAGIPARFLQDQRPLVYVTLGSSGSLSVLGALSSALARLPVVALIATAGRIDLGALPPNIEARPFVRGQDVARRAQLVISNGGSTTGYQALSEGKPVIGLPSNLDQYLATEAIVRSGAGLCVKARLATTELIEAALLRGLHDGELSRAALRVRERLVQHDSARAFRAFVLEAIRGRGRSPVSERGRQTSSEAEVAHLDR
jgi:UDP:flavonoid glycosyltransferase YjiC (YdhE family)